MFYINQNIPCKKIETFQFSSSIEILTLEINLGKDQLIFGTYKPPSINNSSFLNELYNWTRTQNHLVLKRTLNHLAKLGQFGQMVECSFKNQVVLGSSPVAVTSPSEIAPASSKEFLDIQATIECGFTLKRVRDMTTTYRALQCNYFL